jgi:predicted Zn-dependent protease
MGLLRICVARGARAVLIAVFALSFGLPWVPQPRAADRISLIRDAEIETGIRSYAVPLFEAANLGSDAVAIHLVNDSRINAFVAGGLNLFINTGLIEASATPNEVIGVIAHEIGHIEGGHLIRRQEAIENATAEAILAMVLGTAVAAAGGGQAGSAIMHGGTEIAQRGLMRYSRTQESSADQAAMRYLDATGQSAKGLLKLFEKLEDQDLLSSSRQSPYLRSHPLTRERISFAEHYVAQSPFADAVDPPERLAEHQRMVAKLVGFLETPDTAFRLYPTTDTSVPARYARAATYHRLADLPNALKEIDSLIDEFPNDPYFHELKGQILFEQGRVQESIAPYQRATELAPQEPLIHFGLGRSLIEAGDEGSLPRAIENLKVAAAAEPTYPPYWHFLGVALGRHGELAESSLAFAEAALLNGRGPEARFHAQRAVDGLRPGTPQWIRAQDILNEADNRKEAADR